MHFKSSVLALVFLSFVTTAFALENAEIRFDERKWKLGWEDKLNSQDAIQVYILEGETMKKWSEMVTVQSMPGFEKEVTVAVFEAKTRQYIAKACPNVQWKSLSQTETESLYEWSIQGCKGQSDQSEIARIVRTDEGLHIFHYAIKKVPMPEKQHDFWKSNLGAIKVIKK